MTKREKKFRKIIAATKTQYSYREIDEFLTFYGFECTSPRSLHFVYRREQYPHIVLVVHHQKIQQVYVKRLIKILRQYHIIT